MTALQTGIQGVRLSPQQKRIWELFDGDRVAQCRVACVLRIDGATAHAVVAAFEAAIRQYSIFGTTFRSLPGMRWPLQQAGQPQVDWEAAQDFSRFTSAECDRSIGELLHQLGARFVDRHHLLPVTAQLISLSPSQHRLLLLIPSLLADRETMACIAREMNAYLSGDAGSSRSRAAVPLQYGVVSDWLNDVQDSSEAQAGRDYWKKQDFRGNLNLTLPFQRVPESRKDFSLETYSSTLGPEISWRVRRRAAEMGVSQADLLLACWQVVIWQLTGQGESVVGLYCDGRTDDEMQGVMGVLGRYVPVKSQIRNEDTFCDLVRKAEEAAQDARGWQECFTWDDFPVAGRISSELFFPFCFVHQELQEYRADDVLVKVDRISACLDRCNVELICTQRGESLSIEWQYNRHCFSRAAVETLAKQMCSLLISIDDNLDWPIARHRVMNDSQKRRVLRHFNETDVRFPDNETIHTWIRRQVQDNRDRVAVVCGDQQITFGELNRRSNRVAAKLVQSSVGPEVLVGVYVERSIEVIVSVLAIIKVGGAYVPIDPSYPKKRIAYMLEDSQIGVLLTHKSLIHGLPCHSARVICVEEDDSGADCGPGAYWRASEKNAAYVIYTSGSTGNPKGTVVSLEALYNHMMWMQKEFSASSEDRILQRTPLSFDASVWEVFAPLMWGSQMVIAGDADVQDSERFMSLLIEKQVTIAQLVPSLLRVLLDEEKIAECRSLRRLFCGGEVLTKDISGRFQSGSSAQLINLYGPTEACIDATAWPCCQPDDRQMVPIGHPISNLRAYIVDANFEPVPVGIPGELQIGGVGLARGYLGQPQMTAERFIPDPLGSLAGARVYQTGDLARYDPEGCIDFLGRADHQVKVRGFRIELGEIEAALRLHAGVSQAVVIAYEESPGDERLVACVIPKSKPAVSSNELRTFLGDRLPDYMVPTGFVVIDRLPLLPNGKVDRNALLEIARSGGMSEKAFVEPTTDVQHRLAAIWSEILKVPRVSIHDHFFELGGHSLLVTRVISRLRAQFEVQLPLRTLFEAPTVYEMAKIIETMSSVTNACQPALPNEAGSLEEGVL